jgi:hypothetical protein
MEHAKMGQANKNKSMVLQNKKMSLRLESSDLHERITTVLVPLLD